MMTKKVTAALAIGIISALEIGRNAVMAGTLLPCSSAPTEAALAFFRTIEAAPNGGSLDYAAFSEQMLRQTSPASIRKFVEDAQRRYKLDGFDRPLTERLVTNPRIESERSNNSSRALQISFLSYSQTGRIEQTVTLVCERDTWKVLNFAYGPGNTYGPQNWR